MNWAGIYTLRCCILWFYKEIKENCRWAAYSMFVSHPRYDFFTFTNPHPKRHFLLLNEFPEAINHMDETNKFQAEHWCKRVAHISLLMQKLKNKTRSEKPLFVSPASHFPCILLPAPEKRYAMKPIKYKTSVTTKFHAQSCNIKKLLNQSIPVSVLPQVFPGPPNQSISWLNLLRITSLTSIVLKTRVYIVNSAL